ncbi:MAG: hypothetical protein ABI763_11615 [Bacteroidota bacterium]
MIKKNSKKKAEKKLKRPLKSTAKNIAVKKNKASAKGKTKIITKKKKAIPTGRKPANTVVKKGKALPVKTTSKKKNAARKKAGITDKKKIRKVAAALTTTTTGRNKTIKTAKTKIKRPDTVIIHGEDLHFIPQKGNAVPINTFEARRIEKNLNHHAEVAINQENQKMKQAMASRKNAKRNFGMSGRR